MKSVMKKSFSRVPHADISRSSFDRSSGVKTTFDGGYLVPFFADEALPGDTFNLRTSGFARMATPLHPIMDNLYMDTFYFSVPLRLLWTNFVKMMGEQTDPSDSVDYSVPTSFSPASGGYTLGSLQDYLGLPTEIETLEHSALFTRAYNLIWNEWFRDQNLQDSVTVDTGDGPDTVANYVLLKRGKRHDYFTSCLPWPQKGTAVDLPLGTSAPIIGDGTIMQLSPTSASTTPEDVSTTNLEGLKISTYGTQAYIPDDGSFGATADLSGATAATINQLRQAFQVQVMYERDARGGTRYAELIRSHFNVTDPMSAVLQRPEYLGGGSTPVNVHPVAATNDDATNVSVGQLGAFGTAAFQHHGFTKSFTEHSIIIGLVNVRADLTYQQGLNRMWSREDKLDFYWPALSGLGEQAVLNKEIYAQGSAAPVQDGNVFGYQERFAEYRYKPSTIHGLFRSNATGTLDSWHLSQEFASLPVLGDTFIQDSPPIDRVVATPSEPDFIADFHHQLICARPMPMYGVPSSLGRF
ncbi:major capsid protein [Microviridae sp.]|nr:major capsid protein [Microviridae sp.]